MSAPRAIALRVGPTQNGPAIELEFADGEKVLVDLDIGNASNIADRLRECVDGRVNARPASRRVLEIPLVDPRCLAETEPPSTVAMAIVPDLENDRRQQGPIL